VWFICSPPWVPVTIARVRAAIHVQYSPEVKWRLSDTKLRHDFFASPILPQGGVLEEVMMLRSYASFLCDHPARCVLLESFLRVFNGEARVTAFKAPVSMIERLLHPVSLVKGKKQGSGHVADAGPISAEHCFSGEL